jgi:hypothetical protein
MSEALATETFAKGLEAIMASFEEIFAEGLEAGFRARGFEPTERKIDDAAVSVSARDATGAEAVATSSRKELLMNQGRDAFVALVRHRVENAIEAASA